MFVTSSPYPTGALPEGRARREPMAWGTTPKAYQCSGPSFMIQKGYPRVTPRPTHACIAAALTLVKFLSRRLILFESVREDYRFAPLK